MYMHFNYIQCLEIRLSKAISQTASNEMAHEKVMQETAPSNHCPIFHLVPMRQFHSKVVRIVSRDRVRVYPGTEGTNQNRH